MIFHLSKKSKLGVMADEISYETVALGDIKFW